MPVPSSTGKAEEHLHWQASDEFVAKWNAENPTDQVTVTD